MFQARAMKEKGPGGLQVRFNELAEALGWRWYHPPRAVNEKVTAGFPDNTLVNPPRLLFAELKQQAQHPEPAQREWLDDLAACGVEVYVWRPYDLISGEIRAVLMGLPIQDPLPTSGRDGGLTRRR